MKREGDPADFGLLVGILRSIPQWTQAELAQAAGVDRASISDYERGIKAPSRKTLEKIVKAVGVPLARAERLLPALRSLRLSRGAAAGGSPAADLPASLSQAVTEIAAAELASVSLELPAFSGAPRDEAASPLATVVDRLREESAQGEVDGTERSLEAAALARRVAELSSRGSETR